ncbi:MAG: hypothetical protein HOB11_02915 [Flavobacteriaceae bacterium]|nr:hypothetical protein [Flavobacteriaceae bacterium]
MKLSLYLKEQQPNKSGECEIYYRIRSKVGDIKISTDVFVKPKDFKNGSIKVSHPRYNFLNKSLNRIRKDLDNIITDLNEDDDVVTPKRVKLRYEELVEDRDDDITELLDFWNGYEEYLEIKKLKSYGYLKTLKTLENHLRNFEILKKRRITYEWIVKKTLLFQTEFNDYLWNTKSLSNSYVNKIYDNLSGFLYYSHDYNYFQKPYNQFHLR